MSKSIHRLTEPEKKILLDLCRQAIAIDSTNPTGNLKLAKFYGKKFRALGFRVRLQPGRFCGADQANLIARIGPKRGKCLVLNTHLDTVTTDPGAWTRTGGDPFHAVVKGGRLYGLGSADTKLAMACQWLALAGLGETNWKRPLIITGTYGEEMGLVGAEVLAKERFFRGAQVLNSEPSELKLALGNKGLRIYQAKGSFKKTKKVRGKFYKIEFTGRAAHSARPHLGKNALLMALKYLSTLPVGIYPVSLEGGLAANITAPRAILKLVDTLGKLPSPQKFGGRIKRVRPIMDHWVHPEAPEVFKIWLAHFWRHRRGRMTHNVGFIHFTKRRWEILFDMRIPVKFNFNKIEQLIKKQRKLTKAKIAIERDNRPFLQRKGKALQKRVARILRSQGHRVLTEIKWGGTEASVFGPIAGEVLTFGPGCLHGVAHQPNEYVELRQLFQATLIYRELFKEWNGV